MNDLECKRTVNVHYIVLIIAPKLAVTTCYIGETT
jgi:hypothetical protein